MRSLCLVLVLALAPGCLERQPRRREVRVEQPAQPAQRKRADPPRRTPRHAGHEHPHGGHPHARNPHHHHPHPHPHLGGDGHHHPY